MDIIPKKSKKDKRFPVDTHGSRINRKQDFLKIEWPSHRSYYGIPPEAESYRSAHHTFYIVNPTTDAATAFHIPFWGCVP